ncbi:hypothetical protein AAFF_G00046780 [Aldrovandia affinis]|uniref:Uncharacterized protein n=1 Tax=Aldrovandia affinis TaxID=143900 RepID=A0AAD7WEV8_9TELE|nr:hypothetical protein AAFF_G00046780 [Aldrovandia affinis]
MDNGHLRDGDMTNCHYATCPEGGSDGALPRSELHTHSSLQVQISRTEQGIVLSYACSARPSLANEQHNTNLARTTDPLGLPNTAH